MSPTKQRKYVAFLVQALDGRVLQVLLIEVVWFVVGADRQAPGTIVRRDIHVYHAGCDAHIVRTNAA